MNALEKLSKELEDVREQQLLKQEEMDEVDFEYFADDPLLKHQEIKLNKKLKYAILQELKDLEKREKKLLDELELVK